MNEKEFEEFLKECFKIIALEHAQMPEICPKCGGKMRFVHQAIIVRDDFIGDEITYECEKCGLRITKRFPFSPSYRKFFVKKCQ